MRPTRIKIYKKNQPQQTMLYRKYGKIETDQYMKNHHHHHRRRHRRHRWHTVEKLNGGKKRKKKQWPGKLFQYA